MARPRIAQSDDQIGFHWVAESGGPVSLPALMLVDDEPDRLPPTHLEALDDALIDAAGRFGELLGGGRPATSASEQTDLRDLHRVLDRLIHEYATATARSQTPLQIRAGQIIGTAALIAIRARMVLGLAGPTPFAGELDDPSIGVVAGRGQLQYVDTAQQWRGARWVVQSEDGRRYPLTLSTLLFDSSGVNKDAALDEHREALRSVTRSADGEQSEPLTAAGAVDWLLYDWLMAHRESPESGAIEIQKDHPEDAAMIVTAAAAAVDSRAATDPSVLAVVPRFGSTRPLNP